MLKIHHNHVQTAWTRAAHTAAPIRPLHAVRRSRLRTQGGRRDRPVSGSAAACRRVCGRRKDRHSGAGPVGSGAAAVAWPRRAAWVRVLPTRDAVVVCRLEHEDRRGARARPCPATRARRSSSSSASSWPVSRVSARSMSFSTTCRRIKRAPSPRSSKRTRRVHLHFTPTYSSWLNQVELWFGRIERDLLTRGIFTSVNDLARQIRRYIRHYNDVAKPIRWKYSDPTRRITGSTSVSTGH